MNATCRVLSKLVIALLVLSHPVSAEEPQKMTFGKWSVECGQSKMTDQKGCKISLAMSGNGSAGKKGYHTFTINHPSGDAHFVGSPSPIAANVRVDKNTAEPCVGSLCFFSDKGALAKQCAIGEKILFQAPTAIGVFEYEEDIAGYREALKAATEWGYPVLQ